MLATIFLIFLSTCCVCVCVYTHTHIHTHTHTNTHIVRTNLLSHSFYPLSIYENQAVFYCIIFRVCLFVQTLNTGLCVLGF